MKKIILLCLICLAACGNNPPEEQNIATATPEPAPTEEVRLEIPADIARPQENQVVTIPAPIPRDENLDKAVEINITEAPDPDPSPWANAAEMVAQMQIGWNLGNSLDAHPSGNVLRYDLPVSAHEAMWNNPVTTEEHILAIRDAGFDVLRIPVTWYPRMVVGDENHTIRQDWMNRVIEVVNWGLDAGMFVILNTHHEEHIFGVMDDELEESVYVVQRLWEQIGYIFRDYPHKLIFEGLNEPRTIGSDFEWRGGTPEERANVNILNQTFVDTVRAIGGNNTNRMLMVPTYAASAANRAILDFVLPQDPTNEENKLIVSLHIYEPYNFALTRNPSEATTAWDANDTDHTGPIIWALDRAVTHFVSNGIPVIIGEMAALNRDNLSQRVAWAEFYVREAAERGMPCVWWDNGRTEITTATADGFGIFNRRINEFAFPEILDVIIAASAKD